jgi:uncharacterized membrane protein YoaK (UPF0700 family)
MPHAAPAEKARRAPPKARPAFVAADGKIAARIRTRGEAPMNKLGLAALLSFNGGFVDTAGYLGLQGLFTAHVTGNFVTLGAAVVFGTQGVLAKVLALPEFVLVIALAHVAGIALRTRGMPAPVVLRLLLAVKVAFLFAFFLVGVTLGPFPNSDAPAALVAGFSGIAAMAVQNATQRVHLGNLPPTTIMTGNTTQAVLDAVELAHGVAPDQRDAVRARFTRTLQGILVFAAGCAAAAALYAWIGFYGLAVPVVVGAASAIIRTRD